MHAQPKWRSLTTFRTTATLLHNSGTARSALVKDYLRCCLFELKYPFLAATRKQRQLKVSGEPLKDGKYCSEQEAKTGLFMLFLLSKGLLAVSVATKKQQKRVPLMQRVAALLCQKKTKNKKKERERRKEEGRDRHGHKIWRNATRLEQCATSSVCNLICVQDSGGR
jgi:hypothetical protein